MYKIFKNGCLVKITKSIRCVEYIVEKFINNWIEGDVLIVEKDGKPVDTFCCF